MVFPPPPNPSLDWSNIGFKVRPVNGHVQCTYSHTTGSWTSPVFTTDPFLRIHAMAPGLNYGQQCYEGLKAFRLPGDDRIAIFRPDANARRMQHSAKFVAMPEVPEELFLKCVHLAVATNADLVPPHASGASMYIRPLLFGSSAQLGLNPPDEYTFLVFVLPTGVYHGVHPISCLILDHFDRAAPEGTGSAKIGGNYAPVLIHSEAARKEGYGITLHLDSKTRCYVDEFSTSGFLAIRYAGEKTRLVVADSNSVIKSITSDSVQQIARDLGWEVEKRLVKYEELREFDEVFAAGTAAALVPIKSITCKSRGDEITYKYGDENPAGVMKLLTTLKGIQNGTLEDKHGWRQEVKEPEEVEEVKTNGSANVDAVNAL